MNDSNEKNNSNEVTNISISEVSNDNQTTIGNSDKTTDSNINVKENSTLPDSSKNSLPTDSVTEININNSTNVNSNINSSAQDNSNIPTTVSTTNPQPQVTTIQNDSVQAPQPTTTNTIISADSNTNEQQPKKKESGFKYFLAMVFLIGMLAFVFFLPNISTIVETKLKHKNNVETTSIENGVMNCTLTKSSDETDTTYESEFNFTKEKLITQANITTVESLNASYLDEQKKECDQTALISNNTSGVTRTCNLSTGILTITEVLTLKDIDTNKLTSYVEAGGNFPKFKYEQNINNIQTQMLKSGYDCEIKSKNN